MKNQRLFQLLTVVVCILVLSASVAAAPLTRAEMARLLGEYFYLPQVDPLIPDEPVERKFTYLHPNGVIDASFAVPAAEDIVDHPDLPYIEGLIKVRAVEVANDKFYPDAPVSRDEFAQAVRNVVYGVDATPEADVLSGVVPDAGQETISVEEATEFLDKIQANLDVVTVFITADIHGHLKSYRPRGANMDIGGMAKMAQLVAKMQERQPNTLLVDVGDAPYNTNIANLFEGRPVIEIMNYMGYDAMAIGNHDFDFPFNVMERNAGLAEFPFLSANTYFQGEYPSFLQPSTRLKVAGVELAFVGLTDDQSAYYTHPRNVKGITFEDHFAAARKALAEVADANIKIALAHLHGDNSKLGEEVPGFDFIFGGGQDIVDFPRKTGDAWLISSGKHAELISQLNINLWNKQMIGFNFGHIFMTPNLPGDPQVEEIIADYSTKLDAQLKTVVGKSTVDLDGERATVRAKESNLGNAIADSLRHLTGADIALQNGGGIRASLSAGEITILDIYTVLPFDNTVVVIEASGKTILEALENGVKAYPSLAGAFLQVSGMSYTFDPSRPAGERIVEVKVDGKPLELDKTYTVAANDFLTGGGDHYSMLAEAPVVLKTKHFLRDACREYLEQKGAISPEVEGRITILE